MDSKEILAQLEESGAKLNELTAKAQDEGGLAVALELGKNMEQVIAERDRARRLLEISDARVNRYAEQIDELEARLAEAEAEIGKLGASLSRTALRAIDAETRAEMADARNALLFKEKADAITRIVELEARRDAAELDIEAVRADAAAQLTTMDTIFLAGERQADFNWDKEEPLSVCPYDEDTQERHWWTRGYSYKWRALRALKAEANAARLEARLAEAEANYYAACDEIVKLEEKIHAGKLIYEVAAEMRKEAEAEAARLREYPSNLELPHYHNCYKRDGQTGKVVLGTCIAACQVRLRDEFLAALTPEQKRENNEPTHQGD